jgi:peptidoglycan hydrolase-like protein with peptidoglycan-binding domain
LTFDSNAAGRCLPAVYLNRHEIGEDQPMRLLILALSVLGILVSADAAKAGPSTDTRDLSASTDPAILSDEATQATEDQIGLNKAKRRDVQRRLTRLGFDTKASGRFDASTRAVITRWQAARDYPKTGFLNTLQHQALLTESVSTANASSEKSDRRTRRRGGGGGPVGVIGGVVGGVVGGIFGRR